MELKTSRIPVLTAYSQLLAEGYFETWALRRRLAESSPRPGIGAHGFQAAFRTVERGLPHMIPVESPSAKESYLYQLERSLHIQMVCG